MVKIVINKCCGGYGLSDAAVARYNELRAATGLGLPLDRFTIKYNSSGLRQPRHDPCLVQVVEEMGDIANGSCAQLEIEEIDDMFTDTYTISEYDGIENLEYDIDLVVANMIPSISDSQLMTPEEALTLVRKLAELRENYCENDGHHCNDYDSE